MRVLTRAMINFAIDLKYSIRKLQKLQSTLRKKDQFSTLSVIISKKVKLYSVYAN